MSKRTNPTENAEFADVDAAIKRAAKAALALALALARKTKAPCYVWKDGAIVNLTEKHAMKKPDNLAGHGE